MTTGKQSRLFPGSPSVVAHAFLVVLALGYEKTPAVVLAASRLGGR
jgi:hypothetical protein